VVAAIMAVRTWELEFGDWDDNEEGTGPIDVLTFPSASVVTEVVRVILLVLEELESVVVRVGEVEL
jgi:hypothetical protein